MAASSGSCPCLIIAMAFSTARKPLPLATTMGRLDPGGSTGAAPIASVLRLAAVVVCKKRRRFTDLRIFVGSPKVSFDRRTDLALGSRPWSRNRSFSAPVRGIYSGHRAQERKHGRLTTRGESALTLDVGFRPVTG